MIKSTRKAGLCDAMGWQQPNNSQHLAISYRDNVIGLLFFNPAAPLGQSAEFIYPIDKHGNIENHRVYMPNPSSEPTRKFAPLLKTLFIRDDNPPRGTLKKLRPILTHLTVKICDGGMNDLNIYE